MHSINCSDFDIADILECGQCFRFNKLGEKEYKIIAFSRVLNIRQDNEGILLLNSNKEDYEKIWKDYFDIDTDYSLIKKKITSNDSVMKAAVEFAGGIRILNQDPWECLISFIISQNNRIPMIQGVIKTISESYGTKIGDNDYAFPTKEQLKDVSENDFLSCKTGFRAKYLRDAVSKVNAGEINFELYKGMKTSQVAESLKSIFGVGPKVADCVMLFSLKRKEVFPTDVWIKRIMQHYYFDGTETAIENIHKLAFEKYSVYAGYAQQYLFHYARTYLKNI